MLKLILGWVLLWKQKKILKYTYELAEKLYKPVTRKFQRRLNVNGINEIWAADLRDMQAFSKYNNGIKYLQSVIDIFSKFVWIIPLKRKTEQEVANAFSRILKEQSPSKMRVHKGREFYNREFRNYLSAILQKAKNNLVWLKDLI